MYVSHAVHKVGAATKTLVAAAHSNFFFYCSLSLSLSLLTVDWWEERALPSQLQAMSSVDGRVNSDQKSCGHFRDNTRALKMRAVHRFVWLRSGKSRDSDDVIVVSEKSAAGAGAKLKKGGGGDWVGGEREDASREDLPADLAALKVTLEKLQQVSSSYSQWWVHSQ